MPTKHIDNATWDTIESLTVKAVGLTGKLIKETDVIRLLVETGARYVTEQDLKNINGFKPKYGVVSWSKDGTIRDLGTISPEDYATLLTTNQPLLTGVYGQTGVGKTNFKDRLLTCLPVEFAESIQVRDADDGLIAEDERLSLFKSFFEESKSLIIVEHAYDCSSMITKFVRAMANSNVNFIFSGEVGANRKSTFEVVSRVMRKKPEFTYLGEPPKFNDDEV